MQIVLKSLLGIFLCFIYIIKKYHTPGKKIEPQHISLPKKDKKMDPTNSNSAMFTSRSFWNQTSVPYNLLFFFLFRHLLSASLNKVILNSLILKWIFVSLGLKSALFIWSLKKDIRSLSAGNFSFRGPTFLNYNNIKETFSELYIYKKKLVSFINLIHTYDWIHENSVNEKFVPLHQVSNIGQPASKHRSSDIKYFQVTSFS